MRERCYDCFRPTNQCFCHAIPRINNLTDILILQHVRERRHSFNTARIVHKGLLNCRLVASDTRGLAAQELPLAPNAGLLYPLPDAPCLSELAPQDRPSQLVIIDGTWHQAKTIVRDVEALKHLPCFRLMPTSPSQYRIRLEPNEFSISTLEATAAALEALEPETKGIDQLVHAFDVMVENQLAHRGSRVAARHRIRRNAGLSSLPSDLRRSPDQLVVAYGEKSPGERNSQQRSAEPLNWYAERLGTCERFECTLQPNRLPSEAAMGYMRLTERDFDAGVSTDEFCKRWSQFLRADDVLVVYHARTASLLNRLQVPQPRRVILKALYGQRQAEFRSLEELVEVEQIPWSASPKKNRAERRLELTLQLLKHLRTQVTVC